MADTPHIFISHSSRDAAAASDICMHLERAGKKCWMAPRDIVPGSSYAEAIIKAIESSRCLIVLLSRDALASHQVLREVERAASKGLRLIPVFLERLALTKELEYFLSGSQWLDATERPIDSRIPLILAAVGDDQAGVESAISATTPTRRSTSFNASWSPRKRKQWGLFGGVFLLIVMGIIVVMSFGTRAKDLAILTDPPGAEVSVNGVVRGLTPLTLHEEGDGNRSIRLKKNGYVVLDTLLSLQGAERCTMSVRLNRLVVTRPGGSDSPVANSPVELAQELARQLPSGTVDSPFRVVLYPLTIEDTGIPSAFSRYLNVLLTAELVKSNGWEIVEGQGSRDAIPASSQRSPIVTQANYSLRGNYWFDSTFVRFIGMLVDESSNAHIGATSARILEVRLPDRYGPKPSNYSAVRKTLKAIRADSVAETGLAVRMWTNRGIGPVVFKRGERMQVFLRVNKPSYVRLIYQLANGRRILLLNNRQIGAEETNRDIHAGEFECDAPFGAEVLQAVASTSPLPAVRTRISDGYSMIVNELPEFMASFRGMKRSDPNASLAEAQILVTTMER